MTENTDVYQYFGVKDKFIGLLSIPHSGLTIPPEMREYIISNSYEVNRDVDFAVDQLVFIEKLTQVGIAVLKSNIHRTACDLNRPREAAIFNWKKNSHGKQIITGETSSDQHELFLANYYDPYFEVIKSSINDLIARYGHANIIDLHSMPSKATKYHLKINPNQKVQRPHFCLSDINGKSCSSEFMQLAQNAFNQFSDKVTVNNPYFGGHITRFIHSEFHKKNNIQIEIRRDLYMCEENQKLKDNIEDFKHHLTEALIHIFKESFHSK